MGERGPIPEPIDIRKLKSRRRAIKQSSKAVPVPTYKRTPSPPTWLDEAGKRHWRQLAPSAVSMGTLDKLSHTFFAVLCDQLSQVDDMRVIVERDGLLVEGPKGRKVPHPLLKPLRDVIRITNDLLKDFGLTEVGRRRLHIVTKAEAEDPLEAFLKGEGDEN